MLKRCLALLVLVIFGLALAGPGRSEPPLPTEDPGILVQPRGPVHEAFAKPPEGAANPGLVSPKPPPEPVPEVPPDQKPEGDNVQWLPGYWSWDSDRGDYVWISGFWRVPPPNRKWVPGYWQQTQDGWQWVAGYWAPGIQEQPSLLEKPPDSLDYGPAIPAPHEDCFYIPGTWIYGSGGYGWQPGFWSRCQPGWVWSPAYYCWTPGGYLFVSGYWDRCLERRGLLFAPVVFQRPFWQQPGWCYRPRYVVDTGTPFFSAFFSRPASGHYYFGDYFGSGYARNGYRPWWVNGPRTTDPLSRYYTWQNRNNPAWMTNMRQAYLERGPGTPGRTPRTLTERVDGLRQPSAPGPSAAVSLVSPLSQFQGRNLRLATVHPNQRVELQGAAGRLREIGRQRSQLEIPGNRKIIPPQFSVTPPAFSTPPLSSRITHQSNPLPTTRISPAGPPATLPGTRLPPSLPRSSGPGSGTVPQLFRPPIPLQRGSVGTVPLPQVRAVPPRDATQPRTAPGSFIPGPRGSMTPGRISPPPSWSPPSHMSPSRPSFSQPSAHGRREHRK